MKRIGSKGVGHDGEPRVTREFLISRLRSTYDLSEAEWSDDQIIDMVSASGVLDGGHSPQAFILPLTDLLVVDKSVRDQVYKNLQLKYGSINSLTVAEHKLRARIRAINARDEASKTPHPPVAAEYFIYLLLPKKQRIALLGDLNEDYLEVHGKFGKKAAAMWYWKHAISSFGPLLGQCIVRLVQLHHWMAK